MLATFDPASITRPDPVLLTYYMLASFRAGPAFPVLMVQSYVKYRTLRYRFDSEGVSMSWGFLFRHEINLTYRRIQDIHLTRNIVQRWMGLATVAIQTASGSSSPEMTIEGILLAEQLRDFLYLKMRGAKGQQLAADSAAEPKGDEALSLLIEIRDLLRRRLSAGNQTHE